jgi:hypothetical protein
LRRGGCGLSIPTGVPLPGQELLNIPNRDGTQQCILFRKPRKKLGGLPTVGADGGWGKSFLVLHAGREIGQVLGEWLDGLRRLFQPIEKPKPLGGNVHKVITRGLCTLDFPAVARPLGPNLRSLTYVFGCERSGRFHIQRADDAE